MTVSDVRNWPIISLEEKGIAGLDLFRSFQNTSRLSIRKAKDGTLGRRECINHIYVANYFKLLQAALDKYQLFTKPKQAFS